MTPYYERAGITIYHGDALDILPQLPTSSVDCLLADPPYSSGGAFRGDRSASPKTKYVRSNSSSYELLPDFHGDTMDQWAYLHWSCLWIRQALAVLVPGGIAGVFSDWRQLLVTANALQMAGGTWRGIAVWDKGPDARPSAGFSARCEYLIWGSAGPLPDRGRATPKLQGVHFQRALRFASGAERKQHIAQKPEALMRHLVEVAPEGGTVLDPFIGSGTTLLAAHQTGRHAIGIDIDERNCEIAAKRLEQAVLPLEIPA